MPEGPLSGPGMTVVVNISQLQIEVSVALCCRDRHVAKQLLKRPEVHPAPQQMRGEGMTENVGIETRLAYPGKSPSLAYDPPDVLPAHCTASACEEEAVTVPGLLQQRTCILHVPLHPLPDLAQKRDGTFLLPLAEGPQKALNQIRIGQGKTADLAGTKPAPIGHFHESPIPDVERPVSVAVGQQTFDLTLAEDLGELPLSLWQNRKALGMLPHALGNEVSVPGADSGGLTLDRSLAFALPGQTPEKEIDLLCRGRERRHTLLLTESHPSPEIPPVCQNRILRTAPLQKKIVAEIFDEQVCVIHGPTPRQGGRGNPRPPSG